MSRTMQTSVIGGARQRSNQRNYKKLLSSTATPVEKSSAIGNDAQTRDSMMTTKSGRFVIDTPDLITGRSS